MKKFNPLAVKLLGSAAFAATIELFTPNWVEGMLLMALLVLLGGVGAFELWLHNTQLKWLPFDELCRMWYDQHRSPSDLERMTPKQRERYFKEMYPEQALLFALQCACYTVGGIMAPRKDVYMSTIDYLYIQLKNDFGPRNVMFLPRGFGKLMSEFYEKCKREVARDLHLSAEHRERERQQHEENFHKTQTVEVVSKTLQKLYRRIAKKCHPDKHPVCMETWAKMTFQRLELAYRRQDMTAMLAIEKECDLQLTSN